MRVASRKAKAGLPGRVERVSVGRGDEESAQRPNGQLSGCPLSDARCDDAGLVENAEVVSDLHLKLERLRVLLISQTRDGVQEVTSSRKSSRMKVVTSIGYISKACASSGSPSPRITEKLG